jgi:acylphosphatase
MIARRIKVRGRVQGVGFRAAMAGAARLCGVAGWVRNRVDGTVEVFVQGDEAAVLRAVDWCRHGPPAARVTAVEVAAEPPADDCVGFAARPTV